MSMLGGRKGAAISAMAMVSAAVATGCVNHPARWGQGHGANAATLPAGATPGPREATKPDYTALMDREVTGQYPSHELNLFGGGFTAQLQATAPPVIQNGQTGEGVKVATLTFRIGSSNPMVCYVRATRDPSSLLDMKLDEIKREMAKNNVQGRLETPEVSVDVEGSHPVLYLDVPVTVQAKGGGASERPGLIKLAFSPRDGGTVLCMHDEVGYKQTFRRIVGGLVTTGAVATDTLAPVYTEIGIAKSDGKAVGFSEAYETVKDGQVKAVEVLSLVRSGKSGGGMIDRVERVTANARGEILDLQRTVTTQKETLASIDVKRGKAGNDYVYEGNVQNTKVKGSFVATRPLETKGALASRMLGVASGKLKETHYPIYNEGQRLEAPIDVTVTREDPKTLSFKNELGEIWQASIDALGLPERIMMGRDKNGDKIVIERAYSQGQPSASNAAGGVPVKKAAPVAPAAPSAPSQ